MKARLLFFTLLMPWIYAAAQPVKNQSYKWPGGKTRAVVNLKGSKMHGKQLFYDREGQLLYDLNFQDGLMNGTQKFRNGNDWRTETWKQGRTSTSYKYEVEDGGRVVASLIWECATEWKDTQLTGRRYLAELYTYYGDTQRRSISMFKDSGYYALWSPAGFLAVETRGTAMQPAGAARHFYQEMFPGYEGKIWARGSIHVPGKLSGPQCHWAEPGPEDIIVWLEDYIARHETVEFDPDRRFENGNWWYYDTAGLLTERLLNDTQSFWYYQDVTIAIHRFNDSAWGDHRDSSGKQLAYFHSYANGSDTVIWIDLHPNGKTAAAGFKDETFKVGYWDYYDSLGRRTSVVQYQHNSAVSAQVFGYLNQSSLLRYTARLKRYDSLPGPGISESAAPMYTDSFRIWYHDNGTINRRELYVKNRYDDIPHLDTLMEWDSSGRMTAFGNAARQVRLKYDETGITLRADTLIMPADIYWSKRCEMPSDTISMGIDTGMLVSRVLLYPDGNRKMWLRYGGRQCEGNLMHGHQTGWYRDGMRWFDISLDCGKLSGTSTEWYPGGNVKVSLPDCNGGCKEEVYYSLSGKTIRYSPSFTEESIRKYNTSGNKADLVPVPRPAQAQSILEESFIRRFLAD